MLIVALSGRSLANAARAAGYRPLVVDLFGDLDTRVASDAVAVVRGGLARGLGRSAVLKAAESVTRNEAPAALVYGSGVEGAPATLAALARRWPLAGNDADLVARLKNPVEFAELCHAFGIPHPETRRRRPRQADGWLAKRAGGSGGVHVVPASRAGRGGRGRYYQRQVEGEAVSLAFLADGRSAVPIGFTRQWADPAPGMPWRYGGAVRVAASSVAWRDSLRDAAARFAGLGLKGLNSADFLVSRDGWWLLEINPRPGAALDAFGGRAGDLLRAHMRACKGEMPARPFAWRGARAAAIAYATQDVASVPAPDWPDWTADRQSPGTRVGKGEPLCTVLADAPTEAEARRLVGSRLGRMRSRLQGAG